MTILDDYLEEQSKYESKYGPKTIVFMMVGMFYEIYGVQTKDEKLGKVSEMADLLNIMMTRKNKQEPPSRKNHLMVGVPNHSVQKYVSILIQNNWTVVMIDQTDFGNGLIERKVSNIYSPGTILECNDLTETNNLLSVYLESVEQPNKNKLFIAGISLIDVSTGKNIIYETNSLQGDENLCLDEIYRFINIHSPREIIINTKNVDLTKEQLSKYLEIQNFNCHININQSDENIEKISYQMQFLERIFPNTGMLNVIEYLDLERHIYGIYSYLHLLRFAKEHNPNVIQKIDKPLLWNENKHLLLSHSCIYQLNLVSSNHLETQHSKYNSLFQVLNNTRTVVGKRLLKKQLLNPIINSEKLIQKYDYIDTFKQKHTDTEYLFQTINDRLENIRDIERLHRKISLGMLPPLEFYTLDISYSSISDIMNIISMYPCLKDLLPNDINLFNEYQHEYRSLFDLDEIVKYNFTNITQSFFKIGVNEKIDSIQHQIEKHNEALKQITSSVSYLIDEKNPDCLKIEHTDRDGYYICTTKKRGDLLKKRISDKKTKQGDLYDISFSSKGKDKYELKISPKVNAFDEKKWESKKIFKTMKEQLHDKVKKINAPLADQITEILMGKGQEEVENMLDLVFIDIVVEQLVEALIPFNICNQNYQSTTDIFTKVINLEEEIQIEVKRFYLECLENFYNKYERVLQQIVNFVGEIDIISNNAFNSHKYKYCRPQIDNQDKKQSFLIATEIRHPIIELIEDSVEYVKNSISLGCDGTNGILLYGVNASGKSSLMKSVGLCIIMAQCGMFVPCSDFIYKPYHNIFTRISNNDNIFKGQSTFAVEMSELRSILKRTNENSLVLGDELCSGTEMASGQSIVAAGIMCLSKLKTSFIFATHMHQLVDIEEINCLEDVKYKHLKVHYDYEKSMLIYDRQLSDGPGDSTYGLEVCKAMDLDREFLEIANNIRNKHFCQKNIIEEPKKSPYHNNIYIDSCNICRKPADDMHHIRFQSEADSDGYIGVFHKNTKHNLVPLCKDCHNDVHHEKIIIKGYIDTSDGRKLDYFEKLVENVCLEKKNKKKINDTQIDIILKLQNMPNMSQKKAKLILKEKNDIVVSISTISKIWKNQY